MSSFEERMRLTETIERQLTTLFDCDKVSIYKFGCETITKGNQELGDYLKEPEVNQQASAMIVKFAPDFILLKKDDPKKLYFLDVKHSVTPIWSDYRLNIIRKRNMEENLTRTRIGVVAREALLSYRRYYPNTIILMASPYNPKLVMVQFAEKVKCLYCHRNVSNSGYDCNVCPSKTGGFFDIERANGASGSKTPITNVDLDSFEPVDRFFHGLGIYVNQNALEKMKENLKHETIQFNESVDEEKKNQIKRQLKENGCDWIN